MLPLEAAIVHEEETEEMRQAGACHLPHELNRGKQDDAKLQFSCKCCKRVISWKRAEFARLPWSSKEDGMN